MLLDSFSPGTNLHYLCLHEPISKNSFDTPLTTLTITVSFHIVCSNSVILPFIIPNLRVGTHDSLLALSHNHIIKLGLFGMRLIKYPTTSPLKEIVEGIHV
ncbi:putative vacuolar ATP synthase subunit C superfamily [Helianthus debilis subsp. tardiflorus]